MGVKGFIDLPQLFGYKVHSTIGRTPNSATSLLHVFKLKISLKYLVIRHTVVWGVKISQVYCKFFHKLTKKRKKSHIDFSLPLINASRIVAHATMHTNKSLD